MSKVLTQYATHANMIADTVRAAFARTKLGAYTVGMTAPEDSTKGGLLALQHLVLRPETGLALVVGTINAGDKRAELRSYAEVAKVNEERFKQPLGFDAPAYAAFLEKAGSVLGAFGIETEISSLPGPSFADLGEPAPPRQRSALPLLGVALLAIAVVGTWLALRH